MRQDPVLVLATPRSGSSMVTAIFAAHGLWTGPLDPQPNHGYANFENAAIKAELLKLWVRNPVASGSVIRPDPDRVRAIFEREMPPGVRFVYKATIAYWMALDGVFADPRFVFVRRPIQSVWESLLHKRYSRMGMSRELLRERAAFMEGLAAERGIPIVDAHRVVKGEYASLARAFEYCEMDFNPVVARSVINPRMWTC